MPTLSSLNFKYSANRFGLWRLAFGLYLFFYYVRLFPFARELYTTTTGMPPAFEMAATSFYPTEWLNIDSSYFVYSLLSFSAVCALLIAGGVLRKSASFVLWLCVMWMFNRNKFSDSPELGFVNWLVFLLIFIPTGESFTLFKSRNAVANDSQWDMPAIFYWGGWVVLSLGYAAAGIMKYKMHDPVWQNGSAFYYVLAKDNARWAWFGNFFDSLPLWLFYPASFGGIYFEILAPLLCLFKHTRLFWWVVATITHLLLIFFVNITQVSFGMIFIHLFVFDEQWVGLFQSFVRKRKLASTSLT